METPKKLTKAQREAVEQLSTILGVQNRVASHGLLDKMKDLFS